MNLSQFSQHYLTENKAKLSLIVSTVGLAVALHVFIIRPWLQQKSRKRRLMKKISEFRQKEEQRRTAISNSSIDLDEESVVGLTFEQLLTKLANGQLSASNVLSAYQKNALKTDADINAITEFIADAEKQAVELDAASEKRPLHGIPVSLKECFFVENTETTAGHSQYLGRHNQLKTAPIIDFLRWQGCVPFVKTNLSQGMMSIDSRNPVYGITTNPLDPTRSPGGSSSGEGALLGQGASILGLGSDIGGSLRIPAAWCGLYALKPSSNRMLIGGDILLKTDLRIIAKDFYTPGFMAQDVDTLVAVYRRLYSADTFNRFADNTSLTPVEFRNDLLESQEKLTIGFVDFDGVIEPVPAVQRALQAARRQLQERGHRVVNWQVPRMKKAFLLFCNTLGVDGTVDAIEALRNDVEVSYPNQMTYMFLTMPSWLAWIMQKMISLTIGHTLGGQMVEAVQPGRHPHDMNLVCQRIEEYRREFTDSFFSAHLDALILPVLPCPAVSIDLPRDVPPAVSYSVLLSMLNWPAGVCPAGKVTRDDETRTAAEYPSRPDTKTDLFHQVIKKDMSSGTVGLPVAVQVTAPQFREELILRVMNELSPLKPK